MKIVASLMLAFAICCISCDSSTPVNTANHNVPSNATNSVSGDRPAMANSETNGASPTQILQKTVATYAAGLSLSGTAKFETWSSVEGDNDYHHQRAEFGFVHEKNGDKVVELTSKGDKRYMQRMSLKDNFVLSDYGDRTDFDDANAAMKAFQQTTQTEFLIGEILFQDEGSFFLKMGLVLEGDERVNGTECFVISVVPASGLKRKLWITKDRFLVRKYQTESCTPRGACVYTLEEYEYRS